MVGNLRPCPFCGGIPELLQGHADITYITCNDCGCVASFRPYLKGRASIEKWNARAPAVAVQETCAAQECGAKSAFGHVCRRLLGHTGNHDWEI